MFVKSDEYTKQGEILMRKIIAGATLAIIFCAGNLTALADTTWVDVQHWYFEPPHLNGPPGTTVIWINFDTQEHTVISDEGLFNSGILSPGQSFTYTFNDSGLFYYHDSLTLGMDGHFHVHGLPDLWLLMDLNPINAPIVVPSEGGFFSYSATGTNQTNFYLTYSYWAKVYPPDNAPPIVVFPEKEVSFAPNGTRSAALSQYIPASYPPGVYRFAAYLGYYWTTERIWDHFYFTKANSPDFSDGSSTDLAEVQLNASAPTLSNYPEPFNPSTTIRYQMPDARHVSLNVYDISGRMVAALVDGWHDAGLHEVTFDGSRLASGLYLARVQAGEVAAVHKMMLVK
jgi:plastocyanin